MTGAAGMTASAGMTGAGGAGAAPTFTSLYETIFKPKCAACHGAGLLTLTDKMSAYMALVNVGATMECGGMMRVLPGKPEMSVLIMAVKAEGCRLTGRMPPTGDGLSEAEIERLSAWIRDGAKND